MAATTQELSQALRRLEDAVDGMLLDDCITVFGSCWLSLLEDAMHEWQEAPDKIVALVAHTERLQHVVREMAAAKSVPARAMVREFYADVDTGKRPS